MTGKHLENIFVKEETFQIPPQYLFYYVAVFLKNQR